MFGKTKKTIALAMTALALVSVFSGCSKKQQEPQNVTLMLWGSQDDQSMLQQMADNFKSTHKDNNYTVKLGVCDEDTASASVIKNKGAAADVFAFTNDKITAMHNAGALLSVTNDTDKIKSDNLPASVTAASVNGLLYAYPSSNDTYFLYYNKKLLNEKDVKSLEGIMSKQLPSDVSNFAFNLSNGFYGASFFLTTECQLFGSNGTDPKKCTFNSDKGILTGNFLINFHSQVPKFVDYGTNFDSTAIENLKDRKVAACVSDLSNAAKFKQALGSDFAATKLPTMYYDSKDKQMVSYSKYTLYGVNAHTKNPNAAMELAEFLTNQDNQKIRFEKKELAPTNKNLAADKSILSDAAVKADLLQNKYSKPQPSVNKTNFWTPIGDFGTLVETNKTSSATMQKDLDKMVKAILNAKS